MYTKTPAPNVKSAEPSDVQLLIEHLQKPIILTFTDEDYKNMSYSPYRVELKRPVETSTKSNSKEDAAKRSD
jgi:hypothetical protein